MQWDNEPSEDKYGSKSKTSQLKSLWCGMALKLISNTVCFIWSVLPLLYCMIFSVSIFFVFFLHTIFAPILLLFVGWLVMCVSLALDYIKFDAAAVFLPCGFFFVCRVVVSCSNAASVWSVFVCTVCPVHYIWISQYALKWRIAWIWALFIQFHLDMISVLARLTMAASFFSPFLSHPSPSSSSSPIIALLGAALVMLFMNRSLAKCI